SEQMHNRGNGKGGGIAAVGLNAEQLGVPEEILQDNYLLQIAYLDPSVRETVENEFILPYFTVNHTAPIPTVSDYREIKGLAVKPPDVWRYFVRVKPETLKEFETKYDNLTGRASEDEFIYQNTYRLNHKFYASLGEKRAFVVSHGRNMMVLKIVGYAEEVIKYYQLEDLQSHLWIAHQRYPTKGRVWHPGGAHPFIGLNEALIHNGDFANYHSVSECLKQHGIAPLFLTDTEVAVLLFDLWSRTYKYPLEYIIEALAPTTERDFDLLPLDKQKIYRAIQATHIHGSPDGPWFFIIGRTVPEENKIQMIGITDTSMLRPQVFALSDWDNAQRQIGLIASEKQAIDTTLQSLKEDYPDICPVADKYWNARGGSHTDGGSFVYTLSQANGSIKLSCADKFGQEVPYVSGTRPNNNGRPQGSQLQHSKVTTGLVPASIQDFQSIIKDSDYPALYNALTQLMQSAKQDGQQFTRTIETLTWLRDHFYPTGDKKRSSIVALMDDYLTNLFQSIAEIKQNINLPYTLVTRSEVYGDLKVSATSSERVAEAFRLPLPGSLEETLVIQADGFPSEGDDGMSRVIVEAYRKGWKKFIVFGLTGQRFCGNGLGTGSGGVRIDLYGSSGDYTASGLDGAEVYIHNAAQDQIGQILKRGKVVIFGDVGQTFMYGAKGGEVYVLGNAAGRPLIDGVGQPRVLINGTCLDYLAESFMAGDPLDDGGFVILNGIRFDDNGKVVDLATPYPGGNLFSLATGGAIYVRDPEHQVDQTQLHGGQFEPLTAQDWQLIKPYLEENERLFGISINEHLLNVNGEQKKPEEVYRKITPELVEILQSFTEDM
ncbi:MAG: glutamate synthase, partial [Planctomycetes bacterium]|nr:glutamate synthase [Planctomycetota bacterium]